MALRLDLAELLRLDLDLLRLDLAELLRLDLADLLRLDLDLRRLDLDLRRLDLDLRRLDLDLRRLDLDLRRLDLDLLRLDLLTHLTRLCRSTGPSAQQILRFGGCRAKGYAASLSARPRETSATTHWQDQTGKRTEFPSAFLLTISVRSIISSLSFADNINPTFVLHCVEGLGIALLCQTRLSTKKAVIQLLIIDILDSASPYVLDKYVVHLQALEKKKWPKDFASVCERISMLETDANLVNVANGNE
ncbi:hypothetical protein niasHT_007405 [Heterodera trifolii]